MEQSKAIKHMIQYNRSVFETTFASMAMLQDQVERTTQLFLGQASCIPAEGKKAIEDWIKTYKTGRESYKNAVDESFRKVETFFGGSE